MEARPRERLNTRGFRTGAVIGIIHSVWRRITSMMNSRDCSMPLTPGFLNVFQPQVAYTGVMVVKLLILLS